MTRRNFIILYIGILLFFLALTSCGSKKQCVVLPSDFKGPKELSRLYGVRLTPNDNIFLYNEGARWLGVPHRMGGLTKKGVDCKKVSRANLKEGDLVFFRTGKGRKKVPNHVGIYLKNGKFIHTSTSNGVIVSSLSEPYYVRTWLTGGQVKNL